MIVLCQHFTINLLRPFVVAFAHCAIALGVSLLIGETSGALSGTGEGDTEHERRPH